MLYENESFQLNPEKMPKHVAIIMDGNGRWATKRGLPRKAGHKAGAEALERIIYAAKELGLEHLTVYAFSTENWKRSAEEVGAIMDLLRFYLKNYFPAREFEKIRFTPAKWISLFGTAAFSRCPATYSLLFATH